MTIYFTKEQMEAVNNYPNNYKNHGVSTAKLKDKQIQELIKSVLSVLDGNPELNETYCTSGNTIVHGYKVNSEDGGGTHIIVSKNYESYYIDNKVL